MRIVSLIAATAITAIPSAAVAAENGLPGGQQLAIVGGCVIVGGLMGGFVDKRPIGVAVGVVVGALVGALIMRFGG